MLSSQRITTNVTLVPQARKEDMARSEENKNLMGKVIICLPIDHSERSGYGNVKGQEISNGGNTMIIASPRTRSTSTSTEEAEKKKQGKIEPPLNSPGIVFYYDSESDSEYEIPKLSQADINDSSRQMDLSNILDF